MEDETGKTGSGGNTRRFAMKRGLVTTLIVIGVIIVAGGAGVGVRLLQNKGSRNGGTAVTNNPLPKTVSTAQDLRLSGDTAAADKEIDKALADKNTSANDRYLLYIQKAAGYSDQKNYSAAADAYAQAAAAKQTSQAYDMLGDAYAAAGQKDKAVDAYKKAIPLVPNSPVQDDDKAAIQRKIDNLESGA